MAKRTWSSTCNPEQILKARLVKKIRLDAGLNQKMMADMLGFNPKHISNIECCHKKISTAFEESLERVFGIDFELMYQEELERQKSRMQKVFPANPEVIYYQMLLPDFSDEGFAMLKKFMVSLWEMDHLGQCIDDRWKEIEASCNDALFHFIDQSLTQQSE